MATESPTPPKGAEQDVAKPPVSREVSDTDYEENKTRWDQSLLQQQFCVTSQHSHRKFQTKPQEDSPVAVLCAWIVEHQIGTSLISLQLDA